MTPERAAEMVTGIRHDTEDWLDEQLLADDESERGWKRKAVGMTTHDALMGIPKECQVTIRVPIEAHRALLALAEQRGIRHGVYCRQAVGMALAEDGYPPELLEHWGL